MTALNQILAELLAATPEIPGADLDVADVIAAAAAMTAARQPLLAALAAAAGPPDATSHELVAELRAREAGWTSLLDCARHQLAGRIGAARRLRYG